MSKFPPPPSPYPSMQGDNRSSGTSFVVTQWEDNSELTWLLSEQSIFTAVCDLVISLEQKNAEEDSSFFGSKTFEGLVALKTKWHLTSYS